MLKVYRLYSEPSLFEHIEFRDGINLILGETTETSDKTNGVGKSLCIEFLNYCLLKKFSDSRVSKMPPDAFSHQALICLDFSINGISITCKRSIENHESPILIIEGKATEYFNLKDAANQLTGLLFGSSVSVEHPSFRSILGPLIRDERSEFKSLIRCFDTSKRIPEDYTPHLYLLGISPSLYIEAKAIQKEIDVIAQARAKLVANVEEITQKSFKEAASELNELAGQVDQISREMAALENTKSYEIVKNELIELEAQLEESRTKEGVIKSELSKIEFFKGDNYIDDAEVEAIYDRFKNGLGSMIKHDLLEVIDFKKKIDHFQKTLLETRRAALLKELKEVGKHIQSLDDRYKGRLRLLDQEGALKSLKISITTYQEKFEEHAQLSTFIDKCDDYSREIKLAKQERSGKVIALSSLALDAISIKDAFEKVILEIHNYVMGNRRCSFNVEISDKKEIVSFELRIDYDGSHSNEREKVFFYDISLLLTKEVAKRHPGLLVHDNIFDVDQDTLTKSLDYLAEHADELKDKQYILTLNSDLLHPEKKAAMKLKFDKYQVAFFTKSNNFLGKSYQEI